MKNFFGGTKGLVVLAAVTVLLAAMPYMATAQEGQFILHPAYIQGSVSISDGLGGTHSIASIRAVANGTDPITNTPYSSVATSTNSSQFYLVVEGGAWYYTVSINAIYGSYPNGEYCQVNWSRRVTVNPDQTIQVAVQTDAIIVVSYSVAGETITQMSPSAYLPNPVSSSSPQYQFSSQARCNSGQYRLPVVGGSGVFQVYSGSTRLTGPYNFINLGSKQMAVAPGQEAVAAFSTVPGYVEGRITLLGGTLYQASTSIGSTYYDPQTRQNYSASTRPLSDGTFRFPAPPGASSEFYGSVIYDYGAGSHALIRKFGDVVSGETTTVNWTVDLNAGICGDIAVTGINLSGIEVYGYGPNGAYRTETIFSPGEYRLDGLVSGTWGITVHIWDSEYDAIYGLSDYDAYYFPKVTVEVPPGGQSDVDFTIDPGFISGAILAGNSAAIPDLYYARVYAYATGYYYPPYTQEYAFTYQYDNNPQDEHNINIYDLFVAPGDWRVDGVSMTFRHLYPELVYTNECWLSVTERVPNSNPYIFNLPVLIVNSGQSVQMNFGYQTAKITARLRVATGAPLSKPHVSGPYIRNLANILDKYASLNGSSTASNVQEGRVELFAVPGTYRLTAEATVAGATTTFGRPFEVTVQAGDVIVTDPDAPTVVITWPPGNYEISCENCVQVTGTITDENNIASLVINGVPMTIGSDGSFGTTICDLALGENTIQLTASDEYGNTVTIERTVILVNHPPQAFLQGSYASLEGAPIFFSAAGSYDEDTCDQLQYRWDFDNDGTWDTEYSSTLGASHAWPDDYAGTVAVEVFDGKEAVIARAAVVVENVSPEIGLVTGPTETIRVGATANLSAAFSDQGIADTHTALFDWGDGTPRSAGVIVESEGAGTAEGSHVFTAPGEYHVTVTVMDDDGGIAATEFVVTVNNPPVAVLAGPVAGVEGSVVAFSAAGSSDADGDPLQYRWDFDNNGTWDTTYSSSATTTHVWADDYSGTVLVEVYDGYATATASTTVTVANANPVITTIAGPVAPVPVGVATSLVGNFTDAGTQDTHTATFGWGDGTSSAGTIDETGGSGTATAAHVYAVPGVYRVTLTVTDDDGGTATKEFLYAVIYDPTGSFVTGGGHFTSLPGAYRLNPAATGVAGFGFVSKYQKGATTPQGNTQFRFHAGDFTFSSTAYEWLVVAGARAQYKGVGVVNGGGYFGFMLTAIDGEVPGGGGIDRFRIKIWDVATGAIIYDNQLGAADDAPPATAVEQGSVKIHQL